MIWNNITFPVKEEWKDIEGYEGIYKVSNYGRVKSLSRDIYYQKNGKMTSIFKKGRFLKPKTDKDGYKELCMTSYEGVRKYKRVHRIVAEAFLEETDIDTAVIDHIDNTKDNNIWYNLQWMTSTQNTIKYYSENYSKSKTLSSLTKEEFVRIGELYNKGLLYSEIIDEMSLTVESPSTLWEVLCGRRLSSVSGFKEGDFKTRPHPTTKLTEDEVVQIIKERIIDKQLLRVLSDKWGVAESMISRFTKGTRQPSAYIKFKERYNYDKEKEE